MTLLLAQSTNKLALVAAGGRARRARPAPTSAATPAPAPDHRPVIASPALVGHPLPGPHPPLPVPRARASSRRNPNRSSSSRAAFCARGWSLCTPARCRPRPPGHHHMRMIGPTRRLAMTDRHPPTLRPSVRARIAHRATNPSQISPTARPRAPAHPAASSTSSATRARHATRPHGRADHAQRSGPWSRTPDAAVQKPTSAAASPWSKTRSPRSTRLRRARDQTRRLVLLALARPHQIQQHAPRVRPPRDVRDHRRAPSAPATPPTARGPHPTSRSRPARRQLPRHVRHLGQLIDVVSHRRHQPPQLKQLRHPRPPLSRSLHPRQRRLHQQPRNAHPKRAARCAAPPAPAERHGP